MPSNTIFNEDCISGMARLLADDSVDLVITDPPFGLDVQASKGNYNRKNSLVMGGYQDVNGPDYLEFTRAWLTQVKRVLKPSGSIYIFSGWNYLKELLIVIDELELNLVNHLIWKYQFGLATKRKFTSAHYHILFVSRNEKRRKFFPFARFEKEELLEDGGSAHYRDKEDVWTIPKEYWSGDAKTPNKLPAEIIRKMLAYSSEPGDLVLDPFLGSGQTALVSCQEDRLYLGFEVVPEYFEFAEKRLKTGAYRSKKKPKTKS